MSVLSNGVQTVTTYGILHKSSCNIDYQDKGKINKHNYGRFLLRYIRFEFLLCSLKAYM